MHVPMYLVMSHVRLKLCCGFVYLELMFFFLLWQVIGAHEPNPDAKAGICYVETKSLDGETNLKIRQVRCFYPVVRGVGFAVMRPRGITVSTFCTAYANLFALGCTLVSMSVCLLSCSCSCVLHFCFLLLGGRDRRYDRRLGG